MKLGGLIAAAAARSWRWVLMFVLAGHPAALGRASLRIERVLPATLARKVARLAQMFAEGLAAVRQPRQLVATMAWSVPLWLSIAAGIWLVSRAFHIEMPFTGSFL